MCVCFFSHIQLKEADFVSLCVFSVCALGCEQKNAKRQRSVNVLPRISGHDLIAALGWS